MPDAEGFYTLPPVAVMAKAACMSVRSFRRALKVAEDTGWLVVRGGDRYCFTVPDHLAAQAAEMERLGPEAFGCEGV
jgi:hypothetical protein